MTNTANLEDTTSAVSQAEQRSAGKYLTFALAEEEYGVSVLTVREIIKMMPTTAVPQVPAHITGVINLRGKVIPVVDLRQKFGLGTQEYTDETCIIVVEVSMQPSKVMMGIIVDSVSEVLTIASEEIEETPTFGDQVTTEYLKGVAKVKGTVKMLLDLDAVLGSDGAVAAIA
jgi:purine-binding chemotaxis protein CheW